MADLTILIATAEVDRPPKWVTAFATGLGSERNTYGLLIRAVSEAVQIEGMGVQEAASVMVRIYPGRLIVAKGIDPEPYLKTVCFVRPEGLATEAGDNVITIG